MFMYTYICMYAHICTHTGSRCTHCVDPARSRFEPGNRFPCDVTVLLKTHIKSFIVCVGKSTFVLLTVLIPALGSPLSNLICRCARIVLQNGCQVANRETFVAKALSTGSIKKYQGSDQDVNVCALVNIKWFDFNKIRCFL